MKWTDNPMFDLAPSYAEVQAAKKVFLERVNHYAAFSDLPEGDPGYMSPQLVVGCAVAEVWRQGRRYQRDQNVAELKQLAALCEAELKGRRVAP